MLVLYPISSMVLFNTFVLPSFVITRTPSSTSRISPPYAPAFMATAPPSVPGIPLANSNPARPFSPIAFASLESSMPPPACTKFLVFKEDASAK